MKKIIFNHNKKAFYITIHQKGRITNFSLSDLLDKNINKKKREKILEKEESLTLSQNLNIIEQKVNEINQYDDIEEEKKSGKKAYKPYFNLIDTTEYHAHFEGKYSDDDTRWFGKFKILSMNDINDPYLPYCTFVTSRNANKENPKYKTLITGGDTFLNRNQRERDFEKFIMDKYLSIGDPIQVSVSKNTMVFFIQEGPLQPYLIPEHSICVFIYDKQGFKFSEMFLNEYKFKGDQRLANELYPILANMIAQLTNLLIREQYVPLNFSIRHLLRDRCLLKVEALTLKDYTGLEGGWATKEDALSRGAVGGIQLDFTNKEIKFTTKIPSIVRKLQFDL